MEPPGISVQRVSFYLLLAITTVSFLWLLAPFYPAILWAVVLAIVFHPVQEFLVVHLNGRRNIAASLSVVMCVCLAIIPAMLVISFIVQEGFNAYQRLSSPEFDLSGRLAQIERALPAFLERWVSIRLDGTSDLREKIYAAVMQASRFLAGGVLNFGQNTLNFFINFGIMLYLLFFLFRDGKGLATNVRKAIPLSDEHSGRLMEKITSVINATVKGNFVVAVVQGAIGGLAFWLLEIEAALLWGALMTLFSLLPAVGASLVWGPAALYFFATGAWAEGVVLVIVGALIIGLVDNLLRPPLVGKGTNLPDYVVLISTVGGMALFGLNGFVIGPLIAALFISVWSLFSDELQAEK